MDRPGRRRTDAVGVRGRVVVGQRPVGQRRAHRAMVGSGPGPCEDAPRGHSRARRGSAGAGGDADRGPGATPRPGSATELAAADVVAAEDTRRLRRLTAALGVRIGGRVRVVLRAQRGRADRRAAGRPAVGRPRRAGHRRRDAVGVRPRVPAGARGRRRRGAGHRACPGRARCSRRWPCPGCRSTGSAFEGFLPRRAGRAVAPARRPRATTRARWCSSRRRTGSRRRWPRWRDAFGGDRPAAVCRELTKTYEEVRRGSLGELVGVGRRRECAARSRGRRRRDRRGRRRRPAPAALARAGGRRRGRRAGPQGGDRRGGRHDRASGAARCTTPWSPPAQRRREWVRSGRRSQRSSNLGRLSRLRACPRRKAFYVTTPIYYVNDAPHIGHAYTTVAGDVADPLAPAARRAGLVPDRHRRARREGPAQRRRRHGVDAAGVVRPAGRDRVAAGAGRRSTSPTTTSSARPGAAHRRGCRRSCSGCTTPARSTRAVRGPVLRALRGVQAARRAARRRGRVRRPARSARSTAGRSRSCRETNYFFRLSKYADALLDALRRAPGRGRAGSPRATRCSRSSRQGLQDLSISRSSFDWGIPVPWDPEPGRLRLVRRAAQLRDRGRARRHRRAGRHEVRDDVAGRRAPGRQGHPAVPRGDLAGDADGRRAAVAAQGVRARLAARRRREDEQDQAHRHRAARRSSTTSAPTRSATTSCARSSSAQDGSFSWEDMTARYTSELANGFGNLASRVAAMVGRYCDGVLPGAAPTRAGRGARRRQPPLRATAACRRAGRRAGLLRRASAAVWELVDALNGYLTEQAAVEAGQVDPSDRARLDDGAVHRRRGAARAGRPAEPGHAEGVRCAVGLARRAGGARRARRPAARRRRSLGPAARRGRRHQGRGAVPAAGGRRPRRDG